MNDNPVMGAVGQSMPFGRSASWRRFEARFHSAVGILRHVDIDEHFAAYLRLARLVREREPSLERLIKEREGE